ncbi:hypothetical protein [Undibacterium danionis]|uniref:Uncharacterized protein n=1 Tax=Undibacterium danionis TaxID=1812100 RepID=A0ABV6ICW4_9BURK
MKKILIALTLKKIFVLVVLFAMFLQQQKVYSQVPVVAPAANFVVNRAIGGVITRTAITRGFAANDPRIAATLAGASSSVTALNVAGTVAGVGMAVAGAPVWLTIAASMGILAVGGAIIAGGTSLMLNNNSLTINSSGSAKPVPYTPPSQNPQYDPWGEHYGAQVSIYRLSDCFPSQACYAYPPLPNVNIPYQRNIYSSDSKAGKVALVYWSLNELKEKFFPVKVYDYQYGVFKTKTYFTWAVEPHLERAASGVSRLVGVASTETVCYFPIDECANAIASGVGASLSTNGQITRPWNSDDERILIFPTEIPRSVQNLDGLVGAITPSELAEKIAPDTLAKLVDQAWMRAAAQPGYQGLPYSVTQPVTVTDVAPWLAENPMAAPTVKDLLAPPNDLGSVTVPVSPTVTASGTSANPNPLPLQDVNVVNTPKVDLGADPKIPAPTLEQTPSSTEILYPLITLFPELKNYQTPQHVGECPKPQFMIFDKSIVMDSHCAIAEQHRQTIAAVMLTVWILVGIFILLSA